MSGRNFTIETSKPDFHESDFDKTKKMERLTAEYNSIMSQYESTIEAGQIEIAEDLLRQANLILARLNQIDPQTGSHEGKKDLLDADLRDEAEELTREHLGKHREN